MYCTLTEVFLNPTEVSPCFFLSCKANARVKLAKTGHGPHSSTLVVICFVRLLFVLFYVLFVCKCVLPPGDNPIAVNKYIISYLNGVSSTSRHIRTVQCLSKTRSTNHWWINPMRPVAMANTYCTMSPNVGGFSVWNSWRLEFWGVSYMSGKHADPWHKCKHHLVKPHQMWSDWPDHWWQHPGVADNVRKILNAIHISKLHFTESGQFKNTTRNYQHVFFFIKVVLAMISSESNTKKKGTAKPVLNGNSV